MNNENKNCRMNGANNDSLDLRYEAHIQTTENFAEGKIASENHKDMDHIVSTAEIIRELGINAHMTKEEQIEFSNSDANLNEIDLSLNRSKEKRIDMDHTVPVEEIIRDPRINAHMTKEEQIEFANSDANLNEIDSSLNRSKEKRIDMDHTVPVTEIIRELGINAHMTKEEQIEFANSDANLNEIDSNLNRSKGDKSMNEWLDNPNSNGQKPEEIFNMIESEKEDLKKRRKKLMKNLKNYY